MLQYHSVGLKHDGPSGKTGSGSELDRKWTGTRPEPGSNRTD